MEVLLKDHANLSSTVYEALAQGTLSDEMQNAASEAIHQASHLLTNIIKVGQKSDLSRIRQTLTSFKAHCETWDVVNNESVSPAEDLLKLFSGILIKPKFYRHSL